MSEKTIKQYYERIEKLLNGGNKFTYGFLPEEIRQILKWYEQLKQEKQDFIKWLESKNQFHYKNGKIEDNYILVSEVLNKVRGD